MYSLCDVSFISTASFQGWREAPLPFGVPMATWGAGGSGAGGLQDLGFWVAPFACTLISFSARWGHNSQFNNGGNNPVGNNVRALHKRLHNEMNAADDMEEGGQ